MPENKKNNWFPFFGCSPYARPSESVDAMLHRRFRSKGRHGMKTFMTGGPAFFAAALAITLSFGCGEGIEGAGGI